MTSTFLYHEPCPQCGSSDACGVYDDGHKYCFSCRYYLKATRTSLRKQLKQGTKNKDVAVHNLPDDFTTDIPEQGLAWLTRYRLKAGDIVAHRFGWSERGFTIAKNTPNPFQYAPLLVMPIFDVYENLLMWQGRYFGSEKRAPKYWTSGSKDVLHILGKGKTIVLVEDLISCIRVSKFTACMPIFGSDINSDLCCRLKGLYEHTAIWLDKDKRAYAEARAKSLFPWFKSVTVIHSECDPKEYKDAELHDFLRQTI